MTSSTHGRFALDSFRPFVSTSWARILRYATASTTTRTIRAPRPLPPPRLIRQTEANA